MNPRQRYEYWMDIARYDLRTAEHMWETRRYLYVAFMCQQALEKLLKALHSLDHNTGEPPRIHDLLKLAAAVPVSVLTDDQSLLAQLTAYYIEGRYP